MLDEIKLKTPHAISSRRFLSLFDDFDYFDYNQVLISFNSLVDQQSTSVNSIGLNNFNSLLDQQQ